MHQALSSKAKVRPLIRSIRNDGMVLEVDFNMMAIFQSQLVGEVRVVL